MTQIPIRKIRKDDVQDNLLSNFNIWKLSDLTDHKDLNESLHRHNFYFLLAFQNGIGTHEIDFVNYELKNNTVFPVRPGQVHKLAIKQKSEGFILQFDKDVFPLQRNTFDKYIQTIFHQNVFSLNQAEFEVFKQSLDQILKENNLKENNYAKIISSHLDILVALLGRKLQTKLDRIENNYAQQTLLEFQDLLEIHVSEIKRVEKYAKMLNLTVYQLTAITKKILGKTLSEMINDSIVLEAKRHLLATSNQVNQIAYDLGYEDVSYFIRFFKKHTGYSPEAFRKNFK